MVYNIYNSNKSKGFTLIEILITLLISSVVMIAAYQTFDSQQKKLFDPGECCNNAARAEGVNASSD
jgi:prepilin-type N-terminal cleavage/methylation domain-containing protein